MENQPNGLVVSPNQKWLYVGCSGTSEMWRFKMLGNGRLSEGEMWVQLESDAEPDGMTVDSAGFVYVAQAQNDKLAIISPEGFVRQLIPMEYNFPTNCEFQGGTNEKVLFVTHGGRRDARLGMLRRITFK
jgi:sugar lactone lactonase YvrE